MENMITVQLTITNHWPYSRKGVRQKSCVRRSYATFTTARVIHETCRTYDVRKFVVNRASNLRQLGGCRTVCV